MAREKPTTGRLIALEGTRAPDLQTAAKRLTRQVSRGKKPAGISRWDASGTFYEILLGKAKHLNASPRTLLLLYATDLIFRLRWEIRPAVAEGRTVIAAPYLETAIAFGRAAGLPQAWLTELFSFAPRPEACYRIKERKKKSGWKGKPGQGFLEFCAAALSTSEPTWDGAEFRAKVVPHLESLDRRGCRKISKKAVEV